MSDRKVSSGKAGELVVQGFFDAEIGRLITFPHANTKTNAEVADLLVWLNWKVLLVEVKSRVSSSAPIKDWVSERIESATHQIRRSYELCKSGEEIHVRNDSFQLRFDDGGAEYFKGLVVLVFDGDVRVCPSEVVPDIYSNTFPVQVLTYDDLALLKTEIDTFPDLWYYLSDRLDYVRRHDIPLGIERDVVGYYKSHINAFPQEPVDFEAKHCWDDYQMSMEGAITARDSHNLKADLIDALQDIFEDERQRRGGQFPLGLTFAWELGALSRRARAIIGEKLHEAREKFESGRSRRYFAFQNPSTRNWLVFFFSNADAAQVRESTVAATRLKLIKEVHFNDFELGAYGFGFRVSRTHPIRLEGLTAATVIGADHVQPYTDEGLQQALDFWGTEAAKKNARIVEFPPSAIDPGRGT